MRVRRLPRSPAGVLVLLVVLAVAWFQTQGDSADDKNGGAKGDSNLVKVDRVIDGDTAKVWLNGKSEYVRYIGIDTPESVKPGTPVQCYGEESKRFNAELLRRNPKVKLVFDREKRDRYGRLLAYVYSGGDMLNAELIRRGYATTMEIRPNTSKAKEFERLEREARDSGRGLWSAC